MTALPAAIALTSTGISGYLLTTWFGAQSLHQRIVIFYLFACSHILVTGYTLAFFGHLGSITAWATLSSVFAIVAAAVFLFTGNRLRAGDQLSDLIVRVSRLSASVRLFFSDLSTAQKLFFAVFVGTIAIVGSMNLAVIIRSAPHNWDSMTYHLARVAYYLQNGNFQSFNANYIAQEVHNKNATTLLIFTYLTSGRNENLLQFVQFSGYWIAGIAIYGICLQINCRRRYAVLSAGIFLLLISNIMQSTTTQNDMVLTAFLGIAILSLLTFRNDGREKQLIIVAISLAIAIGVKTSALLALPGIFIIALYAWWYNHTYRSIWVLASAFLLALTVFALPAGYLDNLRNHGHPIGPKSWRQAHSFEPFSPAVVLEHGSKNVLRFGFEFLRFDGMRQHRYAHRINNIVQSPRVMVEAIGIDLEDGKNTRLPFVYGRHNRAHEDTSYWGIMGFALIWPIVFLSLAGAARNNAARVLAVAAILFLLAQAYSGPYDPWRGRYFIAGSFLAVPIVGAFLSTRSSARWVSYYVMLICLLGCLSAVQGVLYRSNSNLVGPNSIFNMDRMQQLTRNRAEMYEPLTLFDQIVPADAVVAVFITSNSYEYPLFGEGLTRTLIPIWRGYTGPNSLPAEVTHIVYQSGFPDAQADDMDLGGNLYLQVIGEG